MEAVCILRDIKPQRNMDPVTMKYVDDYWSVSQRLLGDTNFIQSLKALDKDNIPPPILQRLRERYIPREDFTPSAVAKASSAAEGLCRWVRAIEQYDRVTQGIAPKRAALAQAEQEYDVMISALNEKRAILNEVETRLATLQQTLAAKEQHRQQLEDQVEDCGRKLERAQRLLQGLGGEKDRWTHAAEQLKLALGNVVGDAMLASAAIAYLPPFSQVLPLFPLFGKTLSYVETCRCTAVS